MVDWAQADEDMLERLTPDKYWMLTTRQVEGIYLINKLIKTHFEKSKPKDEDVVMGMTMDGSATYWLRKTKLPVAALVLVVGYKAEALEAAKNIRLSVKQPAGLPEPTVSYWGEA